jgi:hypothetical protein
MTTTIAHSTTGPQDHTVRAVRPARAWALAGVVAGLSGIVGIGASMQIDAVYREGNQANPEAIVTTLSQQVPQILLLHTATMVTVVTVLIFAAGVQRRLRAQAPADSILPQVAASGLGLVAVAGLMGAGLTTEFVFGVATAEGQKAIVPESAAFFAHWVGTIPWLWVGAGLAGVTIAVAALRHSAAPRWIGWVGAVLGGVTLLFGLSPLQYMAGFTGPVWLAATAIGFLAADRK